MLTMCTVVTAGPLDALVHMLSLSHHTVPQSGVTTPCSETPLSNTMCAVVLPGPNVAAPVFHPPPDTIVAVKPPAVRFSAYASFRGVPPMKPVHVPGRLTHESAVICAHLEPLSHVSSVQSPFTVPLSLVPVSNAIVAVVLSGDCRARGRGVQAFRARTPHAAPHAPAARGRASTRRWA